MAAVVAVLYMSGYQLPTVFQDRVAKALETGNLDDAGTFTDRAKLISDAWALSEHTIFAGLGVDRFRVRSEERRVGKECVSTCRSRGSQYYYKQKNDMNR